MTYPSRLILQKEEYIGSVNTKKSAIETDGAQIFNLKYYLLNNLIVPARYHSAAFSSVLLPAPLFFALQLLPVRYQNGS